MMDRWKDGRPEKSIEIGKHLKHYDLCEKTLWTLWLKKMEK